MKNKIIATVSSKGGTGKSKFAEMLSFYYRKEPSSKKVALYDGDLNNGSLFSALQNKGNTNPITDCGLFDFSKNPEILFDSLSLEADISFFDLPAGSLEGFTKILDDGDGVSKLIKNLKQEETELILLHPITSIVETQNSIKGFIDTFGENAKHIAFINLNGGLKNSDEYFPYWYGFDGKYGKVRNEFLHLNGREIVLPYISPLITARMHIHKIKWSDFRASEFLTKTQKGQIQGFLDDFEVSIKPVREILGLP
jgi:hypothetical protein